MEVVPKVNDPGIDGGLQQHPEDSHLDMRHAVSVEAHEETLHEEM